MWATSNSSPYPNRVKLPDPGVCTQILRTNMRALLPGRKSLLPHLSDLHQCLIYTTCVFPFLHPHSQWSCSIFKWWKVKTCGYNFYEKLHFEDCYISILLPWGKLKKKKPKYFSPSLTWKLFWRHLISNCKFSPASCWNMKGGEIYSYKCFVWAPSTVLCTTLNFHCTRCLWQVWSAFFPEVHLSRQSLQQTLRLRFVSRRKTRNNIGIAPAKRASERRSTKTYPPAGVWE